MTLYPRFAAHLEAALDALVQSGDLPDGLARGAVTVEPPRDASHGDLATNAAMVLAKPAGTNPRALAEKIGAELEKLDEVSAVSVAGPTQRIAPRLEHLAPRVVEGARTLTKQLAQRRGGQIVAGPDSVVTPLRRSRA